MSAGGTPQRLTRRFRGGASVVSLVYWLVRPSVFNMGRIPQRVFLVGCPRSGTTLLQSMLASHTSIMSFPETHVLSRLGWTNPLRRWSDRCRVDTERSLRRLFSELQHDVAFPETRRGSEWLTWFFEQLDEMTVQRGSQTWIEKTPRHLEYIPLLREHASEARFIHMVRSGTNTIASLYSTTRQHPDAWSGQKSIDECIDRWLHSIQLTDRWAFGPNHVVAHYRTLVNTPERTLRRLCEFLDIEFCRNMLAGFQGEARRLVREQEVWKTDNFGPLRNKNDEKFFSCFTPEERRYILGRLDEADVPWPIQ
ncbi:MAG: sulfotransferase [Bradymonadaceae bacterium]